MQMCDDYLTQLKAACKRLGDSSIETQCANRPHEASVSADRRIASPRSTTTVQSTAAQPDSDCTTTAMTSDTHSDDDAYPDDRSEYDFAKFDSEANANKKLQKTANLSGG